MEFIFILVTLYLVGSLIMNIHAWTNGGFELYFEMIEEEQLTRTWWLDLITIIVSLLLLPAITFYNAIGEHL